MVLSPLAGRRVAPYTSKIREALIEAIINDATKEITLTTDKPELDDAQLAAVAIDTVGTGLFEYLGVLTPDEKITVNDWADTYRMCKPHNELWKLLFAEYTNYLPPERHAHPSRVTLFNIFKADLLGLIVD
ncbi:hypothetical protein [Tunturiibacter gelidiferens]|uniref:hypothetical protein n=1 Tax=Tunturiibacter gelidiferens TaxID=3069689 RepID=UPI003D9AC2F9